jgi:dTMP kinase
MNLPESVLQTSSPGFLFVLEGPDNVGKTSLARMVSEALKNRSHLDVTVVAFPGSQPGTVGAHVHEIHDNPSRLGIRGLTPTSLQALHIAAHLDAIEAVIRPLLIKDTIVLLDRYWWSTWVYGMVSGADPQVIRMLVDVEQVFWSPHRPRAIFLIDRSTRTGFSRGLSADRIRHEYAALALQEGPRTPVLFVANDGPIEAARDHILRTVLHLVSGLPDRQVGG